MRALAFAAIFLLCGCSSSGGHHVTSREPDAAPAVAETCSNGQGYAGSQTTTPFTRLSATVVDLSGNPAAKVTAQACGVNVCLNGTTDARGAVFILETADLVRPAFKYGGGQNYAKFALALGGSGSVDVDLGEQRTVAFDPPAMGAELLPGATAESRGVSLTLVKGTAIAVDPFDYDTPDLKKFRATEIPAAKAPAAVDPSLGLELLFGLTPTGATLCPAAKLSTPNTLKWPALSRVEFFVHGVEVTEVFAPYGGWAKVSDGTVNADGSAVETDAAGGLPILSVIGVRLAPPR